MVFVLKSSRLNFFSKIKEKNKENDQKEFERKQKNVDSNREAANPGDGFVFALNRRIRWSLEER